MRVAIPIGAFLCVVAVVVLNARTANAWPWSDDVVYLGDGVRVSHDVAAQLQNMGRSCMPTVWDRAEVCEGYGVVPSVRLDRANIQVFIECIDRLLAARRRTRTNSGGFAVDKAMFFWCGGVSVDDWCPTTNAVAALRA